MEVVKEEDPIVVEVVVKIQEKKEEVEIKTTKIKKESYVKGHHRKLKNGSRSYVPGHIRITEYGKKKPKNIIKIKFKKELHPEVWGYNKVIPIKTKKMLEYEKKTGKRSIAKYIDKPTLSQVTLGTKTEGKVQLSKGFINWKNK